MTHNTTIRTMVHADLPRVLELSAQLGYPGSLNELEERFQEISKIKSHRLWVALHEGQVAGWIHALPQITLESNAFVEIAGLVVDQNARRLGIGKNLVEQVTTWARELGFKKVRVRSNVNREESHRFYPQIGFAKIKTQHNYEFTL